MAEDVEIRGLDKLLEKLNKLLAFQTTEILSKLASFANTKILQRTASGKDYQERSFKPYSDAYKKTRTKLGLPVNKPDLFKTGRMLGSLSFYVEKDEAHLMFLNPAESLKAYANNQIREFFAISDKDEKQMVKIAETGIRKIIK